MEKKEIKQEIFAEFKQLLNNASENPNNFNYIKIFKPELLIYKLKTEDIVATTPLDKCIESSILAKYNKKINSLEKSYTPNNKISKCLKNYAEQVDNEEIAINMVAFLAERDIRNIIKENNILIANKYRKLMFDFMCEYGTFIETKILNDKPQEVPNNEDMEK